jgi:Extracellular tail, of 10TM putative phosphate transporter
MLNASIGVYAVEQELSTLSSEIRQGVAGMMNMLESVGHKNQNRGQHQTGISPQQEIPNLFSHVSDPDNGKSRQRYTPSRFASNAHSHQDHAQKSHSHSHKADHRPPEHDHDSSGDEEDFHDHASDHPSNYQNQTWIWIPKDKLGLSTILVEELNV